MTTASSKVCSVCVFLYFVLTKKCYINLSTSTHFLFKFSTGGNRAIGDLLHRNSLHGNKFGNSYGDLNINVKASSHISVNPSTHACVGFCLLDLLLDVVFNIQRPDTNIAVGRHVRH